MSGTAPYVYCDLINGILSHDGSNLTYLYDATTFNVSVQEGVSFFEEGCLYLQDKTIDPFAFPANSYNINYPYCRVGVEYRMDDPRSDPLIAQLVAMAPRMNLKLVLGGCDPARISIVRLTRLPATMRRCAITLFPGNARNEYIVTMDFTLIELPCRLFFEATNTDGVVKKFTIAVRDNRSGVPSGAVL